VTLCLASTLGCVQRRMLIRSNPPGAQVFVDNYEVGTTPCSASFTYYGTREIRLVKDGYETLVVRQPLPTPWYEYFPLDFFSENIVPGEIRDDRILNYNLVPQQMVPTEQLVSRADLLRRQARPQPTFGAGPAQYDPYGRQPGVFTPANPSPFGPPASTGTLPSPGPTPAQGGAGTLGGGQWSQDGIK